jgi:ABC-type Na+ efflux pump permease subunit
MGLAQYLGATTLQLIAVVLLFLGLLFIFAYNLLFGIIILVAGIMLYATGNYYKKKK